MQLLVSPHCNLCASSICRCPIGDPKLQTWQIHIWLNVFVFFWKMKLYVQAFVPKNKNSPSENVLDHCAKFCRRVTDVSMSSSSWQRNFNKTLNSCIIPEEKVKTPSLRCKYMYVHKTSFIERANWKPCSFSYWKKKSISSHVCSQDPSQTFHNWRSLKILFENYQEFFTLQTLNMIEYGNTSCMAKQNEHNCVYAYLFESNGKNALILGVFGKPGQC